MGAWGFQASENDDALDWLDELESGGASCPVTDVEGHRKFYVRHEAALPGAALLDPELTLGLPPKATAATGSSVRPNQAF